MNNWVAVGEGGSNTHVAQQCKALNISCRKRNVHRRSIKQARNAWKMRLLWADSLFVSKLPHYERPLFEALG